MTVGRFKCLLQLHQLHLNVCSSCPSCILMRAAPPPRRPACPHARHTACTARRPASTSMPRGAQHHQPTWPTPTCAIPPPNVSRAAPGAVHTPKRVCSAASGPGSDWTHPRRTTVAEVASGRRRAPPGATSRRAIARIEGRGRAPGAGRSRLSGPTDRRERLADRAREAGLGLWGGAAREFARFETSTGFGRA